MDSTSRELISKLNDRLLNQTVIIQTLCNILIDKEVISQDELEKRIEESVDDVNNQLKQLKDIFDSTSDSEEEFEFTNYYGPLGEA